MPKRLSAQDFERARTWNAEIAKLLRNETPRLQGDWWRFGRKGALSINQHTGAWYDHSTGTGGLSTVKLVKHLRPEGDAEAWVRLYLREHDGTGPCNGESDEFGDDIGAIMAHTILAWAVPIGPDHVATKYLRSRGLEPPYPECLKFLDNARIGESALVAVLYDSGRIVGVQVTYLTPMGEKSLVEPVRRRWNLEKAPGAVFLIEPLIGDPSTPLAFAEGVENALCLRVVHNGQLFGVPGIGFLQHVKVSKGRKVVLFRDGDEPGSQPDKGLWKGVDNLLLQPDVEVLVTQTPAGEDANSLLMAGGVDAVRAVLETAALAELTYDGELRRLAALVDDDVAFAAECLAVAKKFKVPVGVVRKRVATLRSNQAPDDGDQETCTGADDAPWDGEINLAQALDAAVTEFARYVRVPETQLAVASVWAAHTHIVHNEKVMLPKSPRLAWQAVTEGSGKTTALEITEQLSHRGKLRSSYTASTIMRTMASLQCTYCLDEADCAFSDEKSDLRAIVDAGDRRHTALLERAVKDVEGRWTVETFNVWGAIAFAGIGELPRTVQDRSIRIRLNKALTSEISDRLVNGRAPELDAIRRHFAAWGAALEELPDPLLPDSLKRQAGRVGDNWRPLLAIADLAGGRWPALLRQAVEEALGAYRKLSLLERLLLSIRNAFDRQAELDDAKVAGGDKTDPDTWPDNRTRLTSKALIAHLIADPTEEWGTANRGRGISDCWLRERLAGLENHHPGKTVRWYTGTLPTRGQHRGFLRSQFERAWETHIPEYHIDAGSTGSTGSSGSGRQSNDKGEAISTLLAVSLIRMLHRQSVHRVHHPTQAKRRPNPNHHPTQMNHHPKHHPQQEKQRGTAKF